jgi:hypothetical protein
VKEKERESCPYKVVRTLRDRQYESVMSSCMCLISRLFVLSMERLALRSVFHLKTPVFSLSLYLDVLVPITWV